MEESSLSEGTGSDGSGGVDIFDCGWLVDVGMRCGWILIANQRSRQEAERRDITDRALWTLALR